MKLIVLLSIGLLIAGLVEYWVHRWYLDKISIRILVNGTRGKSSVTRLIYGALREQGMVVMAKTTGSAAMIIYPDGTEIPIKRRGFVRITETIRFVRIASKQQTMAIVVECMAVQPESQVMFRDKLVRPTIGVLTNVRMDHEDVMGVNLEEIESVLKLSLPPGKVTVTTADLHWDEVSLKVSADDANPDELALFPFPVFAENVAIAKRVALMLGVPESIAYRGMRNVRPDIGNLQIIELPSGSIFINGFAANEYESTMMVYREALDWIGCSDNLTYPFIPIFNTREDREFRIKQYKQVLHDLPRIKEVHVVGDRKRKVSRILKKDGLPVAELPSGITAEELIEQIMKSSQDPVLLFGIGNIKGWGMEVAEYCLRVGTNMPRRSNASCYRNQ